MAIKQSLRPRVEGKTESSVVSHESMELSIWQFTQSSAYFQYSPSFVVFRSGARDWAATT